MKITNIKWEIDGEDIEELGLPTEVELPRHIDANDYDEVNNYLSNTYGWLVISWNLINRYEIYGQNDELMGTTNNLQAAQYSAKHYGAKFIFDTEIGGVIWE